MNPLRRSLRRRPVPGSPGWLLMSWSSTAGPGITSLGMSISLTEVLRPCR